MGIADEDRKRRLRDLESKLRDPRSIINVDCLLDAVQGLVADCDHTAIRKIKNVDAFVSRCKLDHFLIIQALCTLFWLDHYDRDLFQLILKILS